MPNFTIFCESQPPQNSQYPWVFLEYSNYRDSPFSEDFQSILMMPHKIFFSSTLSCYSWRDFADTSVYWPSQWDDPLLGDGTAINASSSSVVMMGQSLGGLQLDSPVEDFWVWALKVPRSIYLFSLCCCSARTFFLTESNYQMLLGGD